MDSTYSDERFTADIVLNGVGVFAGVGVWGAAGAAGSMERAAEAGLRGMAMVGEYGSAAAGFAMDSEGM